MMGTQFKLQLFWLFLLVWSGLPTSAVWAQAKIKTKTSAKYYVSPTDTVLRVQTRSEYDAAGRLMQRQEYFYDPRDRGVLVKEERSQYFPAERLLRESIINYPKGEEPKQERLETHYLLYAESEKASQYIWRRHFDAFGELTREDTLTYNSDSLLTQRCSYNYTGATSILCDEYEYRDTLRQRWRMYSRWTTINARSQVVERQTKRRDYRYRYNKAGQLTRVQGTDYSSKIKRCLHYDKEGQLACDYFVTKREVNMTPTGADGQPDRSKKPKKTITTQETLLRYQGGQMVHYEQRKDGQSLRLQRFSYEGDLLMEEALYQDTVVIQLQIYQYNAAGQLESTTQTRYHPDGRERYRVLSTYNDQGEPLSQEQYVGPKRLMQKVWTYNEEGFITSETLTRNNQKTAEREVFTYTYY